MPHVPPEAARAGVFDALFGLNVDGRRRVAAALCDVVASITSEPGCSAYLVASDCIGALLEVLRARTSTAAMVAAACGALSNVAEDDDAAAAILDGGSISRLEAVIERHMSDEAVVAAACSLIAQLAARKQADSASDCCRQLVAALKMHVRSVVVASAACRAMAGLARDRIDDHHGAVDWFQSIPVA